MRFELLDLAEISVTVIVRSSSVLKMLSYISRKALQQTEVWEYGGSFNRALE